MSDMNVKQIPVIKISDPIFNSRDEVGDVSGLAKSLNGEGQREPIEVFDLGDEVYQLSFGSRRLAAARLLGWKTIAASVVPPVPEKDAVLINGLENAQRKDLTTYQTGRLCAKLRAVGWKGKEISAKLGLSEQYISNVAVCFEMLPEEIKAQWKDEHPACDVQFLRSLVTKKDPKGKSVGRAPEEMLALYMERQKALEALDEGPAEDDDEDEDDEDDGKKGKKKAAKKPPYKVDRATFKAVLTALRTSKSPKIATDVARFLVGEVDKIAGLKVELPE